MRSIFPSARDETEHGRCSLRRYEKLQRGRIEKSHEVTAHEVTRRYPAALIKLRPRTRRERVPSEKKREPRTRTFSVSAAGARRYASIVRPSSSRRLPMTARREVAVVAASAVKQVPDLLTNSSCSRTRRSSARQAVDRENMSHEAELARVPRPSASVRRNKRSNERGSGSTGPYLRDTHARAYYHSR